LFVSFCVFCGQSWAGTPKLSRLLPAGGQRGTTVEVDFTGRHLDPAREVLFYESGISVEPIKPVENITGPTGKPTPVDPGTRVPVGMQRADACRLGPQGVRLRTADGISEYQRFFVSPFPCVDENETPAKRNDTRETAMPVTPNTTVHGRLMDPADVDM